MANVYAEWGVQNDPHAYNNPSPGSNPYADWGLKNSAVHPVIHKSAVSEMQQLKISLAQQAADKADAQVKKNTTGKGISSFFKNAKIAGPKAILQSANAAPQKVDKGLTSLGTDILRAAPQSMAELQATATGKTRTPKNAVGRFLLGNKSFDPLQKQVVDTAVAHPGGFQIPHTPIHLNPEETGVALGALKGGFDVANVLAPAQVGAKQVIKQGAKNVAAKTAVKNTAAQTFLKAAEKATPDTTPSGVNKIVTKSKVIESQKPPTTKLLPAGKPSAPEPIKGKGFTMTDKPNPTAIAASKRVNQINKKLSDISSGKVASTGTEARDLIQEKQRLGEAVHGEHPIPDVPVTEGPAPKPAPMAPKAVATPVKTQAEPAVESTPVGKNVGGELNKWKNDSFWGKAIKPTATEKTVPLTEIGQGKAIGIRQPQVTEAGVKEVMARIQNGERPAILVGNRPMGAREVTVLDGNHTLEAYKRLGIKEVPIIDNTGGKLTPPKPTTYKVGDKVDIQGRPTPDNPHGGGYGTVTHVEGDQIHVAPYDSTKESAVYSNKEIKPKATEIAPAETVKVPGSQLPVGTGKAKTSRLEERMQATLNNLSEEEKAKLTGYNEMNKKEQISAAAMYVDKNPDEALRVLKGEIHPPKGILHNSIWLALDNAAIGDHELALKLASLRSTRLGQEISILSEANPYSPTKNITELKDIRIKRAGGQKVLTKEAGSVKKAVARATKPPTKQEWSSFVESLKC